MNSLLNQSDEEKNFELALNYKPLKQRKTSHLCDENITIIINYILSVMNVILNKP